MELTNQYLIKINFLIVFLTFILNLYSQDSNTVYCEYNSDNLKHGKYIQKYETGEVKVEGSYFKDQKKGVWLYYFKDGTLKSIQYYGEKLDYFISFSSNGYLQRSFMGRLDDSCKVNVEYGQIFPKAFSIYFKDSIVGGEMLFYKDGAIRGVNCRRNLKDTIITEGNTTYTLSGFDNSKEECECTFEKEP